MNAEDLIDNTITNLKIIGMVQKNGRLCVRRGQLTLESDDYLQLLRRWVHKDSRTHALMHVRNTINNAVTLYKDISQDKFDVQMKAWTLSQLAKELASCQTGLVNLKTTYADDSVMVANLDVILNRLAALNGEPSKQNVGACMLQAADQQPTTSATQQLPLQQTSRETRGETGKSHQVHDSNNDVKFNKPQQGGSVVTR